MDLKERNRRIAEAGRATRLKRKPQECKTFKLKIDRSSLTKLQAEQLKMQFIEAKWIYNYSLSLLWQHRRQRYTCSKQHDLFLS